MAQVSRPSPDNSRAVTIAEYEQISAAYMADGLFPDMTGSSLDPGGLAPVYANGSGMTVFVRENLLGAVRGFGWSSGDTAYTHAIGANAAGATRIDRIVLELDRATWNVRTAVVAGTAGFSAPALTRQIGSTGKFQVPLARVVVNPGVATITAGNVILESAHVGSNVKAWANINTPLAMVMGELGFDVNTKRWFGFDGVNRGYLTDDLNPSPVSIVNSDSGTAKPSANTSGTPVWRESLLDTSPASASVSVNFTAGRKGIAIVHVSSQMRTAQAWEDVFFGARIRRVSDNSIVFTPQERQCASSDVPYNVSAANSYTVHGLIPGVEYKAIGVYTVWGADGYFDNRSIVIDPR